MKRVTFTNASRKQFRALPADTQGRLRDKIASYLEGGSTDVEAMKGEVAARLRAGDYRVVFIETDETFDVLAVGHRRDIYR